MSIAGILKKSLRESIRPKRFLPFFLLYVLFSLGFLFLAMTVLQKFPMLVVDGFQKSALTLLTVNVTAIIVVFTLVALLNLWFTGALVYDSVANKGFDRALKYSQKIFWQLLLFNIAFLLLTVLVGFVPIVGGLAQFAVEVLLIFSIPVLVLKNESFDKSMKISHGVARKSMFRTTIFMLGVSVVSVLISVVGLFFISFPFAKLLVDLSDFFFIQTFSTDQMLQLATILLNNYTSLLAASVVASLFMSIVHVFNYLSRTYFFLELRRK